MGVVHLPLGNALIALGGLTLAVALVRKVRLVGLTGSGLVAIGALALVHAHAAAAVPPGDVSARDISHARAAYFRRVVAAEHLAPLRTHATKRWFEDAKLGLMIAYGPTTLFATTSDTAWWEREAEKKFVPAAARFRPDPRAVTTWVALAKRLGASYITVTAKHHDGFGLWDSKLTRWDVGHDRDLIAPLARACRRAHIRLFLYYSLLDLHEPTYATDKDDYLVYVEGQLRELLTRYGPIAGMWFDGWTPQFGRERLERVYALVHHLQPWALVTTNHHLAPMPGEDFQTFESGFPGERAPGGTTPPVSHLPLEVTLKLGPAWFWSGPNVRLHLERVDALRKRATRAHARLLIDIAPRPDGRFDLER